MASLKGLTGLYEDPQDMTDFMDEGVLEARGMDPDPEHGTYGSQSYGYSGTVPSVSPFSGMPVYDGWEPDAGYSGRGEPAPALPVDRTPTSHKAPYPRGIIQPSWGNPDAWAEVGEQISALHSPSFGAASLFNGNAPAGHEEETHYTTDRYDAPNEVNLSADVPGQLRAAGSASTGASGHGNADPVQGYGKLNDLPEFQMGHSIRRVQHDRVPFDYTNTHGEQQVPFFGRHPVGQMPLDGPDSPYFAEGDISGANIPWEGRIGDPTEYVQPVEPIVQPASSQVQDIYAW